jgi:hypothetical protein
VSDKDVDRYEVQWWNWGRWESASLFVRTYLGFPVTDNGLTLDQAKELASFCKTRYRIIRTGVVEEHGGEG